MKQANTTNHVATKKSLNRKAVLNALVQDPVTGEMITRGNLLRRLRDRDTNNQVTDPKTGNQIPKRVLIGRMRYHELVLDEKTGERVKRGVLWSRNTKANKKRHQANQDTNDASVNQPNPFQGIPSTQGNGLFTSANINTNDQTNPTTTPIPRHARPWEL